MQWILRAVSLGVKRQFRKGDHAPPPSAVVKNGEAIPPNPYVLMM
jgi:hypothetical protein